VAAQRPVPHALSRQQRSHPCIGHLPPLRLDTVTPAAARRAVQRRAATRRQVRATALQHIRRWSACEIERPSRAHTVSCNTRPPARPTIRSASTKAAAWGRPAQPWFAVGVTTPEGSLRCHGQASSPTRRKTRPRILSLRYNRPRAQPAAVAITPAQPGCGSQRATATVRRTRAPLRVVRTPELRGELRRDQCVQRHSAKQTRSVPVAACWPHADQQ